MSNYLSVCYGLGVRGCLPYTSLPMKSRAKVARACVALAVGLSCYPVEAESPNRRTGGPSKRSSEKKIYQTKEGELLHLGHGGSAKSGMEPHCPPIYDQPGVDGYSPVLDGRGKKEVDMQIRAAGIALDRAERHAAEWGHASIASAVLVETHSQSDGFYINATGDYEGFATAARNGRQGGASRLIEDTLKAKLEGTFGSDSRQKREDRIEELRQLKTFTDEQYQLELSKRKLQQLQRTPLSPPTPETPMDPVDPDIAPDGPNAGEGKTTTGDPAADAAAQTAAAAALAADPATTTTTTTTTTNNPNYATADLLPKLGDTTNVFVDSTFTDSQTTLKTAVPAQAEDDTPNLEELALLADHLQPSESDVMKTAASNMVMQKILNYLTKPVRAGSDHVPWFMVTQVSVSPGSRTFRDYAAETTLHPYYAKVDKPTGQLIPQKDPKTIHPGIFAAFPLVEAQALDLRNSERYETQLSMAIAAKLLTAGKQTEAKFFLEKMTKVQQDIATRTMLPIVVPNSNGREVTYRFDPGLQALVDPGNRKKGSGMILQPNSVPALIVIMTDRKSLKCYPALHFELHTRWIPKKKSNVWSATWDGIVRNYNPRSAMLPSEVMGAASSMDEAKRRLDWVSWKLGEMGVSSAYDIALEQGRMRCSALMSKIGSYQSNIALPVHFNVLPNDALTNGSLSGPSSAGGGGLKLDSRYEQKIIVERVSGPEEHSDLNALVKVFIGGFPFVEAKEFVDLQDQALKAKKAAEVERKDAEIKGREAKFVRDRLELKMKEVESRRAEIAAKKKEVEDKKKEAANKKREADFKKQEAELKEEAAKVRVEQIDKIQEERPVPYALPEGINLYAMGQEVENLRSESSDLLRDVQELQSFSRKLEFDYQKLEPGVAALDREIESFEADLRDLDIEYTSFQSDLLDLEFKSIASSQSASDLTGRLAAIGYFEPVDRWNAVITLPADRTWTLPTGTHTVTGEFGKPKWPKDPKNPPEPMPPTAITFGTIKLADLDTITVAPASSALAIPPQVPDTGITVTVTGLNLHRVKSAYWNSNLKPVDIISQGKEKLMLHIKVAPPKDTKEILISDSLPPNAALSAPDYSRSIVGSVPVTVQERALALASAAENVKPGTASVTFGGFFPAGTTASLGTDSTPMKLAISEDGSKATVTLGAVFDVLVLGKPSAKIPLVFKSGKDSATVSLNYVNAKVSVVGIYPTVLPAASIPKEMNIVARFEPAYTGDAMVLVGGLSLGVHKVDASGTISIKDLSTRITPDQLEALDKKTDLVLLIGNEPYNMEKVISIVPRPKS